MTSVPAERAAEVTSLAQVLYEGDWAMRAEWRWGRATQSDREVAHQWAEAVLAYWDAHTWDSGERTEAALADLIRTTAWPYPPLGAPGRVRAKAEAAVRWFRLRDAHGHQDADDSLNCKD